MWDIISSLSATQVTVLIIGAMLIGINKTAIPGLGVLPVVMLTLVFETRMSTGIQLGMLALADLVAVSYYRKQADWKILLRLLPWALAGIAVGSIILRFIPTDGVVMKRTIGGIVLALMVLNLVRKKSCSGKNSHLLGVVGFLRYSAWFHYSIGQCCRSGVIDLFSGDETAERKVSRLLCLVLFDPQLA